jgi:hypothetical protein
MQVSKWKKFIKIQWGNNEEIQDVFYSLMLDTMNSKRHFGNDFWL